MLLNKSKHNKNINIRWRSQEVGPLPTYRRVCGLHRIKIIPWKDVHVIRSRLLLAPVCPHGCVPSFPIKMIFQTWKSGEERCSGFPNAWLYLFSLYSGATRSFSESKSEEFHYIQSWDIDIQSASISGSFALTSHPKKTHAGRQIECYGNENPGRHRYSPTY